MADIKNIQAKRLYESLLNHTDERNAERIADSMKLAEDPSEGEMLEWARGVCGRLEECFDADTVKQIRMGCHCMPSMDHINEFRDLYEVSKDLSDFAEKLNDLKYGMGFWYDNGSFFMSYPMCYCKDVNGTSELLPKSWCYCTLGYTKNMFDIIFDCDVRVELLESVKTGGGRCVIKIDRD